MKSKGEALGALTIALDLEINVSSSEINARISLRPQGESARTHVRPRGN